MAATGKLDDLMTMDQLARAVHMNRQRVKDICIRANIAVRWGKVSVRAKLSELETAILSYRVPSPEPPKPAKRKPSTVAKNPDVYC